MTTRDRVYKAITTERIYHNTLPNTYTLSIGEEIALLLKYSNKALDAWSEDFVTPEIEALNMIRKIAGIAVRCMENHGAPLR